MRRWSALGRGVALALAAAVLTACGGQSADTAGAPGDVGSSMPATATASSSIVAPTSSVSGGINFVVGDHSATAAARTLAALVHCATPSFQDLSPMSSQPYHEVWVQCHPDQPSGPQGYRLAEIRAFDTNSDRDLYVQGILDLRRLGNQPPDWFAMIVLDHAVLLPADKSTLDQVKAQAAVLNAPVK